MLGEEPVIVLVGTAGAGKSTLTGALASYFGEREVDALTVNLDPGADKLPYEPGVDIREVITIQGVMEEYGLGPNGAQVAAADLIAVQFDPIQEQIEAYGPDLVLVDTPGQLELFAFRASGPYVVKQISRNPILAFLMDPVVASNPRGFISQAVLAATSHFRLGITTLNVLAKSDTLPPGKVEEIIGWAKDSGSLADALSKEPASMANDLNAGFLRVLDDFAALARLVPMSGATLDGVEELYSLATGTVRGGEPDLAS